MIQYDLDISAIKKYFYMQDICTLMPDRYEIEGEEILEKEVKEFGSGGAHVYAPVAWKGATVKLVRVSEPDPDTAD